MRLLTQILFITCLGAACVSNKKNRLKIAAASSLQPVVDSLVNSFHKQHKIECDITYGSSGLLMTQIINGAPYDVFLSANKLYQDALFKKSLIFIPTPISKGWLTLFYPKNIELETLWQVLLEKEVKRIGIPDPLLAPYGKVAEDLLLSEGCYKLIKDKLVIAESASQVNMWLSAGVIDAGFSSSTYISKFNNYNYEMFSKTVEVTNYFGRIIKEKGDYEKADKFLEFIKSEDVKPIFDALSQEAW